MELLDFNTVVTLGVLVWIIVGFMSGKWSMGIVAMTGLMVLHLTGVLDFKTSFATFSQNNIVMIAAMFVLAGALRKTSLVSKLRSWMLSHAKNGRMVALMYFLMVWVLIHFVAPTALIGMLLPFMDALDEKSEVRPSHLLFAGAAFGHCAQGTLPLGNTLTNFANVNAILEANGAVERVGPFSGIILLLPAAIASFLYFGLWGWKRFPARGIDTSKVKQYKETKAEATPVQEKIIYTVFVANMLTIVFISLFPNVLPFTVYVVPVISVLILCLTGCLNARDVQMNINMDAIFMLCGVLPLGVAMQNSNAATIVANLIVNALGGNPSWPLFLGAFMLVGGVLTQFMSNGATASVFCPLAVVTAAALGYNAGITYLAVNGMVAAAMLTAMGSPSIAIAYGAGGYSQKEVFKACFPAWVIHSVVLFITALILS